MPFQPGQSGNPKGRAKGSKNRTPSKSLLAQERLAALIEPKIEELFNRLYNIAMFSSNDRASIAAIIELFDRSMGKAQQQVNITGDDEKPIAVHSVTFELPEDTDAGSEVDA